MTTFIVHLLMSNATMTLHHQLEQLPTQLWASKAARNWSQQCALQNVAFSHPHPLTCLSQREERDWLAGESCQTFLWWAALRWGGAAGVIWYKARNMKTCQLTSCSQSHQQRQRAAFKNVTLVVLHSLGSSIWGFTLRYREGSNYVQGAGKLWWDTPAMVTQACFHSTLASYSIAMALGIELWVLTATSSASFGC